jgi:DNA-binding NarL/FixJ family response regulator
MENPHPINVLIVDDHSVVREGLRSILQHEKSVAKIEEAVNGVEAVEMYEKMQPDITIMDLRMPVRGGIEAIRLIRKNHPKARILVLSSFSGDEEISVALKAGAAGYLLKKSSSDQIIPALHAIMSNEGWIPPEVAGLLIARNQGETLTPRELQIVGCLALGQANKEIADALGISLQTVKAHLKNILKKLEVGDRTEAVIEAFRRGIVQLPED